MKVLLADTTTLGTRPGDFGFADAGEICIPGDFAMCDSHRVAAGRLSRCGCDRAFQSITSGKNTTSVIVGDTDQTRDEMVSTLAIRLREAWGLTADEATEDAALLVDGMLADAEAFSLGAHVRKTATHITAFAA
jgi:hypothetical protein